MPVLYRKYRPQSWSEVVGQDEIVNTLKESAKLKRLSHAYLFSGSRGTGKTTTARIFARSVETADEDIYEIDAASNRGIDDIRELREHVSVLPFTSPYKVYIIDEVHMLSKDAWNALLKTLEEPPKHVIFILATTELDKVPDTIVSRCQTFTFRRPNREVIRKHVLDVATKEGLKLDPGAADLIAMLGDGSFRDALGTLEKVIATSKDVKLTREEVEAITGAPKASLVNAYIGALLKKDCDKALEALAQADRSGLSINTLATLILEKARFILLLANSASARPDIEKRFSPDDFAFVEEMAKTKALTPAILEMLLGAVEGINRARIGILPLEMVSVMVCG
ncbi:MAG: DNA polymerase III subunit gamma/tau [Candidatus Paceibacterota bacterium]